MNRNIVPVTLLAMAALSSAAVVGKMSATVEATYDSNLPQNMTNYAGTTITPSLDGSVALVGKDTVHAPTLELFGGITYGNHQIHRDPLLNDPFWNGGLTGTITTGVVNCKLTPDLKASYDPDFNLIKMVYRGTLTSTADFGRNSPHITVAISRHDYGNHTDDATRYNGELGWRLKLSSKNRGFRFKRTGLDWSVENSVASGDTSAYKKMNLDGRIEAAAGIVKLSFLPGISVKQYKNGTESIFTGDTIARTNHYLDLQGSVGVPVGRWVDLSIKGGRYIKTSTIEANEWKRWVISGTATGSIPGRKKATK